MKRLLIPLLVLVGLFAAFILFQPSQALAELPSSASSQPVEDIQIRNGLEEYTLQGLPNPPWYDQAWTIRRPLTTTNLGSALTNYQVLVTLDSTFDFNHAQANGSDLRVTASDGITTLSFWIESWDSTAQKAWVWVKLPSLPAGNTVIYLYYGNPSAASASNGKATFDVYDGFEAYAVGITPPGDYGNPGEWTRYPGNPVLSPGPAAWDAAGATFASVISDTTVGQYRMYYHGIPSSGPHQIGLATSNDGKTWTKYSGNPVLTVGGSGAWDAGGVRVPMVWKEGPNDYRMIYTGSGSGGLQVGYATSTNGISWSKYASNPVFNDPNAWAHNSTENWAVIKVGSQYLMWYSDLSAPRESSIAYSTDLIHWTPYASTPIFATSGVPSDYLYSQFCPVSFVYGGYYYVLVPSYTSVSDYAHYYLYRSSSPYFPTSDRHLVRVVHTTGASGQWDALDSDTPFVLTTDIERDTFPGNQLWTYYAGASATGGTWREGLLIETNIAAALTDAAMPGGTLSWTASGDVTVVDSPVRQGLRSLQLNDTSSTLSTNIRGSFASIEKGSLGSWMRRDNTTIGDYDLYLYENSTLAAVAGLGRNGKFHYWNKDVNNPPGGYGTGFHDTSVSWSINTWYLVTLDFDAATDTYDFVVYDQNLVEVVRQSGISFGNVVTSINAATLYSDAVFMGRGYADDYRLRKSVSPAPTVQVGTAQPAVDLAITKTASKSTIYVGDTLTYTVRVNNTSQFNAPAVFVTDTLPVEVSLVSAIPSQGSCSPTSPITCLLGNVPGAGSASIQIIVTATSIGSASNIAEVDSPAIDLNLLNNTASIATLILPDADLSVQQVDDPDPLLRGDPLTYTVTIHNGGPNLAVNARFTDTLPIGVFLTSVIPEQGKCNLSSPVICNLGNIPAGDDVVITIFGVTAVDGVLTNLATVKSDTYDPALANNTDSETTTVLPSAELGVSQVDVPDPVQVGDQLTYIITVHNSGPSSSAVITLTDTLPGSVVLVSANPSTYCTQASPVVCLLPGLPAGGNNPVQVVVVTTLDGLITNTVTVASSTYDRNLANNTSVEGTVVATQADLSVSQIDLPDPVYAGDPLTYAITVHNAGPNIAANITLTDTLPGGVTLQSVAPSQGICGSGDVITCELEDLHPGENATVIVVVNTSLDGIITNTVDVASDTYDEHPLDNHDVAITTVLPSAELGVSQVDVPDPVRVGDQLTYIITVHNSGPSSSAVITLTDTLPGSVALVSANPSVYCTQASPVVCILPGLPAGGNSEVQVVVVTTLESLITNTVTVVSSTYDPNLANNTSVEGTVVATQADLFVSQVDLPDPVYAGDPLTYTITVHNDGPSIAANIRLTDTLPGGVTLQSVAPSQGICGSGDVITCELEDLQPGGNATVIVLVNTSLDGVITNIVDVASDTYDQHPLNNHNEAATTVAPLADLGVSQVDEPDPVRAGYLLTYTLTVHNSGPSSSSSVILTDTLPASVEFISAAPSDYCSHASPVVCTLPGLSAGGESQVQVVVRTTLEGLLTNTVTVASSTYDRYLVNNISIETTVVATSADLSITQVDNPDPVLAEQDLTYTMTVRNAGPSIAASVRLTDTLPGDVDFISVIPDLCNYGPGNVVTCALGNLASEANIQVVVVVKPQAPGSITNTVEVSTQTYDSNLGNNTYNEDTQVLPLSADLEPTLTGEPNPVTAGSLLTYTANVYNWGPSRAISSSVIITLSSEVIFTASTPPCSVIGEIATCPLGEIASGSSAEVTLVVQVPSSSFEMQITSWAKVISAVADPKMDNNQDDAMTRVERSADLGIDILDSLDPVGTTGVILTYTLVYTNYGPSDAINLVLTDTLPADVEIVIPLHAGCRTRPTTRDIICDLLDLEAGRSDQIELAVIPKAGAESPLIDEVNISSGTPDPDDTNNKASEQTSLDPLPPSLRWVTPVYDEEPGPPIPPNYVFFMKPGLVITLTVVALDNIGIDRVRFARWDHSAKVWTTIGIAYVGNTSNEYEYGWVFDSYLDLPPGENAIYAFAYDTAGNKTGWPIWIVPYPYPTLLPLIMK